MPRPRFHKLPHERQERLLDTAAREFATHGFDGASLNHILGAAGISKGAAYYYFDDKADLFATVVDHYFQHALAGIPLDLSAVEADGFWPAVEAFHRQSLVRSLETPWMLGVARAVWKLPPDRRREGPIGEVFRRAWSLLDGILDRGQALGVIRSDLPRDLLMALLMALDETADRWIGEHLDALGPDGVAALSPRLMQLWRRVLQSERTP